ncbi:Retrovirus-related Pol polyprotein from transposon 17.6 [Gossypium australe]|uniref:Retrovirus-related Pol polyprotein from transposon 17.6 n=1 Tax=Gossypium australe TaxID=47621 RepID=A0A5B6VZA1_9ROSI|nr:Retrovirus-related Pol polyprotein from transposon 17.6 [Gossypium australe]
MRRGIEVDKAKVDVLEKLPPPTFVKGVKSFLGQAGFYWRFIKYFSKIAFDDLNSWLVSIPIIVTPDWESLFELMCDASDFVGAIIGQ